MCGSIVDIQSATAENRGGKEEEEERRYKPQLQNIMPASATQDGHNQTLIVPLVRHKYRGKELPHGDVLLGYRYIESAELS